MVETVGFCQVMWFVMLESAKDRILGVDTPGQQVSPCGRYGMTCLLIRYAIGCVSCLLILHPISARARGIKMSLYADYGAIFISPRKQDIVGLKGILEIFGKASGL
jgi:hypothetical protein